MVFAFDPNDPKRKQWIRDADRWRLERDSRYGDVLVRSDEAHRLYRETVGPKLCGRGYTETRKGTWVRPMTPEIFHVVEFRKGKSNYNFFWGVSLTYMPHSWEKTLALHRTLKSARFDLHESGPGYLVEDGATWDEVRAMSVDYWHGAECFGGDLLEVWRRLEEPIEAWLGAAESLEGVAGRAREQVNRRPQPGTLHPIAHHPDPRLVLAFTLARMGNGGAQSVFDHYLEIVNETTEYDALAVALAELLKVARHDPAES